LLSPLGGRPCWPERLRWPCWPGFPLMGGLAYRSLALGCPVCPGGRAVQGLFGPLLTPISGPMAPFPPKRGGDYQRDRLVCSSNPSKDPLGGGYHLLQSGRQSAPASLGRCLTAWPTHQASVHPETDTRLIFSALGEETVYVGSIAGGGRFHRP